MRLRLGAYLTGIVFLGVLVIPFFSSYHNPRPRHIDKAQILQLESTTRKDKKHLQYLGVLSPPPRIAFRIFTVSTPQYKNSITPIAPAASASCRAPPA